MSRRRSLLAATAVACVLAAIATATPPNAAARATNLVTIGAPATTGTIPPGFLGLSLEYFAIEPYAGTNPSAIDPVFVQLIRNLSAGQAPELRIGGDTTDRTWWPVPGMPTPAGVTATLTRNWIDVTHALATQLGAQLTLGINFEADSTKVAAAEANAEIDGIGRARIAALELGNEPELYGSFDWGLSGAPGRPKGYDFEAFAQDFTRIGRALPHLPLAGPTDGGTRWFPKVGTFLSHHPQVAVATIHRYPLESCYVKPSDPSYPTIPHMLAPQATSTLARSVTAAVRQAHAHHIPIRVDEINTISCGLGPGRQQIVRLGPVGPRHPVRASGRRRRRRQPPHVPGSDATRCSGLPKSAVNGAASSCPSTTASTCSPRPRPPDRGCSGLGDRQPAARGICDQSARRHDPGRDHQRGVEREEPSRCGPRAPPRPAPLEVLRAPSLAARVDVTLGGQSFGASTATGLLAGTAKLAHGRAGQRRVRAAGPRGERHDADAARRARAAPTPGLQPR